jgi:hypothetical protein
MVRHELVEEVAGRDVLTSNGLKRQHIKTQQQLRFGVDVMTADIYTDKGSA